MPPGWNLAETQRDAILQLAVAPDAGGQRLLPYPQIAHRLNSAHHTVEWAKRQAAAMEAFLAVPRSPGSEASVDVTDATQRR